MERTRFMVPEPQVAEHAVKAVQLETLQSIGQAKEWQFSELDRIGHGTPPCLTSVTTERDLVFDPVPQVLVHALYLVHDEVLQSMGQGKLLQVLYSLSIGQVTPL